LVIAFGQDGKRGTAVSGTAASDSDFGASAVEYCLVLAGVAAVVAMVIFALGPVAAGPWNGACASLNVVAAEGEC
jgi:pilus assembly protein Flp/PilA